MSTYLALTCAWALGLALGLLWRLRGLRVARESAARARADAELACAALAADRAPDGAKVRAARREAAEALRARAVGFARSDHADWAEKAFREADALERGP